MKKARNFTLFLGTFLALNFLCKQATGDFSPHFLTPPAPPESKWGNTERPAFLEDLFKGNFTYLGKGKQAYVFLSQDKEHVLKVFKPLCPYFRVSFFGKSYKITCAGIPLAQLLFNLFYAKECEQARDHTFLSYWNAFQLLKEETQIEYLHLTKTKQLHPPIKIYDRIGVLHTLFLDSTSFLIQKKTDLFYPTLDKLIQNREIVAAKELISHFVEFYGQLADKGILNPSAFEGNIGCIGTKVVQIDVGRVFKKQDLDPSLSEEDSKIPKTQLLQNTKHLKKWLSSKNPELCNYLEDLEKKQI